MPESADSSDTTPGGDDKQLPGKKSRRRFLLRLGIGTLLVLAVTLGAVFHARRGLPRQPSERQQGGLRQSELPRSRLVIEALSKIRIGFDAGISFVDFQPLYRDFLFSLEQYEKSGEADLLRERAPDLYWALDRDHGAPLCYMETAEWWQKKVGPRSDGIRLLADGQMKVNISYGRAYAEKADRLFRSLKP